MTGESSAVGGGVEVEGHAEHVDSDVMVIPAKGDQILGVMITAEMLFVDVVDLEAVP